MDRPDFPYWTTMILRGNEWELVEVAERNTHEDEIPECADGPTTVVVSFFAREMENVQYLGTINTGPDDPFLRPRSPEPSEEQIQKRGFGWHGRTLEDGVYEVDDDDDDDDDDGDGDGDDDEGLNMGPQAEAAEGDPMPLVPAEEPVEEDFTEVDREKFTENSSLRELREALKICCFPKGKSKADAWERLKTHHKNFTESVAVELTRKEFDRKRHMEGGDGARGQASQNAFKDG